MVERSAVNRNVPGSSPGGRALFVEPFGIIIGKMPYKDPERQRQAQRESVKRRREKINEWVRADRAKRRAYIDSFKQNPCLDCGQSYDPCVMDFHHRDGDEKSARLAIMASERYTYEAIDIEIAKCDVICANCHRLRHKRS